MIKAEIKKALGAQGLRLKRRSSIELAMFRLRSPIPQKAIEKTEKAYVATIIQMLESLPDVAQERF